MCDLFSSILKDHYTGALLLWDLENYSESETMWDPIWGVSADTVDETPKFGILDETNQRIHNSRPSVYLQETEESSEVSLEERMHSHLLSESALNAMWDDDFERFTKARERTIQREIKELLMR